MEATSNTIPASWMGRVASTWASLGPRLRLGLVSSVSGLLLGSLATVLFLQEGEELSLTAAPMVASGSEHLALEGRRVLLKAVLAPRPGHRLTYRWDFGDDSEPAQGAVTSPFGVSIAHTYADATVGQERSATLTIRDLTTDEQAQTRYPVRFVEATRANKRAIALDDALWALHASMKRGEDYVRGPIGHWNTSDHPVGSTAMAVMAFEVNGFDGRSEREGNPYQDTVDRGLAYLGTVLEPVEIKKQRAGDPDSNGNGIGLTIRGSGRPLYEVPLVAMALTASQDPDRVMTFGPEGVEGRTYRELVTDMLDYLAFAQIDRDGSARGGWRYTANDSRADMSVTQWPVLAFLSAREVWGLDAPEWVKTELRDHFLKNIQGADGSFGYRPGRRDTNVGLTGAGLIALSFVDVPSSDERVERAAAYIEANYGSHHLGNYYNMYAVMKGARLSETPITAFGEHDWLTDYVEHLAPAQREDGTWPAAPHAGGVRATAWPALIISKDVFATSRPSTISWGVVFSISALAIAALIGLFLLRRSRRSRASGQA